MFYEVALVQRSFQQTLINRWNYQSTGTPASVQGSFGLAFAMGFIPQNVPPVVDPDTVFGALRACQSTELQYVEVIVKALYDPVDFYGTTFPTAVDNGALGGEPMSPVLAGGFVSSRVRQDIRRGTKRIGGMVEQSFNSGGQMDAPFVELMQLLALEMSRTISYNDESNIITYTPTILSKEKYTTPSGKFAYRYYATEALQDQHKAQGFNWNTQTTVRTQTSRQYGSGI